MAVGDKKFGDLITKYLRQRDRSPSWLAHRLSVEPSTVLRWMEGETRPRKVPIVDIADALSMPKEDRKPLFEAAGLVYIEQQAPDAAIAALAPTPENSDTQRHALDTQRHPLWQRAHRVRRWLNEQESDEEKVLILLRAGAGRVTPPGTLRLLLALSAGWLACWLVIPLLMWPAASAEAHWTASIKFGVATLVIPLLVAICVKPHPLVRAAASPKLPTKVLMDLLLLQFAGATVAFYVGSAVALTISLVVFSLPIVAMTELFAVVLVLLSLLFSYWGARIIPLSRFRMFAALRQHEGDSTVVLAFLLAGPCTAAFLHFNREMLLDQGFILALFVVLVGWLSWETRRKLNAVAK